MKGKSTTTFSLVDMTDMDRAFLSTICASFAASDDKRQALKDFAEQVVEALEWAAKESRLEF